MKKYALIIVDMIKDNVNIHGKSRLDLASSRIMPALLDMATVFRSYGCPVIFACDSFMQGDFIFQSRIPPHAIRGTVGAEPLNELKAEPTDVILPKRRFSAFYKTDLDQRMRIWGVDTAAIAGISTNVCVLMTALDAVQNDFRSVIVSDACACHDQAVHDNVISMYANTLMVPLLRILSASELLSELKAHYAPSV